MKLFLHAGSALRQVEVMKRWTIGRVIMRLKLQFGYGMMEHTRSLIGAWGGGDVVLSPRDLSAEQLQRLAADVLNLGGGGVLIDPQFYLPHADHERLVAHDYWPKDYESAGFWGPEQVSTLLTKLAALNADLKTSAFILPGLLAGRVDEDWLARQQMLIDEADRLGITGNRLATIALSGEAVAVDDDVHELLDHVGDWKVDGFYVVVEHPKADYLVSDPTWLTNVLDLCAGLKLKGRRVVVGYCNHQMLCLGAAAVDALCSGTWMNVRSFPQDKFRMQLDDEIKQRATWYYAPTALSEYKIPFLDTAKRQGVLDLLSAPAGLGSKHADVLFSGVQPTTVGFTEQAAFRHYLQCMHMQVAAVVKPTFEETCAGLERQLDDAEKVLGRVRALGVTGALRDFHECVDANRAALAVLKSQRGTILARKWSTLIA
ncbi:MAG: hypothetical protein IT383_10565 [Deltaproteobacteria bacterium]|nr:hypothetical protein [Deltaproteobacteria bacterium]